MIMRSARIFQPRDSWKYTNLIRNALSVVVANASSGITADQVLIIGPAWMNDNDKTAGAVQGNELYFHGTQWQSGGNSRGPNLTHVVSTYEVMDTFTDMLFDKAQFPNLNQVVIAGHSMGGQATQRYALLKKTKSYDNNMRYWLGNPGSWAWLVSDRPVANASCAGFDDWHYGIGNATSVTKYARKDVEASKQAVIDRFRSRNVHYALGLLDNGAGDTHCQAEMQGANHLDRGSKFIQMLGAMPGGFPSAHTADFIANTSHQDYAMISANVSLQRIFIDGFNDRLPDVTNTTNPGDKTNSNKTGISTTSQKAQKSFATPIHKKISYALLIGSIAGVAIAFAIMPWIFPASNDAWEQDQWEVESKRKLL